MTHADLVEALGALSPLRDKGKVFPAFYYKSRAFLHFHGDEADVRFGADWERIPVRTSAQRQALLRRVTAHVT